ncbi:glycosyltransferase [Hyphomicrobium sp. CS1GBMeth3]|uniref:glycosyltransferase n=1 Tax=Hyphomicrobium sp. CS1GBMeth3 TaxID=1892845 RepID=UPI0009310276|nr:glycosyltransferase [Hyphomicrobium sp. CS1GBMeth3]
MISVIIPATNAEAHLAETLSSLVSAAVDGLVREVIVVDGGSTDRTLAIADDAGADIVKADGGRGSQLRAGAARARFPWLLFLDADTLLDTGWEREVNLHIERVQSGRRRAEVASFRFQLDDEGALPRTLEALVSLRARLLKLPYGDQGLLIPRALYDQVGGFGALPALEDMDLLRRIGRNRIAVLNSRAIVNGERYRRDGYLSHMARGQLYLALYLIGVPVRTIANLFGASPDPVGEPAVGRGAR